MFIHPYTKIFLATRMFRKFHLHLPERCPETLLQWDAPDGHQIISMVYLIISSSLGNPK
jgi:hypothetical protein